MIALHQQMAPEEHSVSPSGRQKQLTQNEQSEAVEQGTNVGQDPHQHSKLWKDRHDTAEKKLSADWILRSCLRSVAAYFLLFFGVKIN